MPTSEIYNNILYTVKEMNYFGGHLKEGHLATYKCIETYKVPAYFGTGVNVDTFPTNILNIFKIYSELTLMSRDQIWFYLYLAEKAFINLNWYLK